MNVGEQEAMGTQSRCFVAQPQWAEEEFQRKYLNILPQRHTPISFIQ